MIVPTRGSVLDDTALAADGWSDTSDDEVTKLAKAAGGDGWGARYERDGKLILLVTCATIGVTDHVLLVLSVSHRHNTKLRDTDRFLSFIREPFRAGMVSYAHAVSGPAQAKWLSHIVDRPAAQA